MFHGFFNVCCSFFPAYRVRLRSKGWRCQAQSGGFPSPCQSANRKGDRVSAPGLGGFGDITSKRHTPTLSASARSAQSPAIFTHQTSFDSRIRRLASPLQQLNIPRSPPDPARDCSSLRNRGGSSACTCTGSQKATRAFCMALLSRRP